MLMLVVLAASDFGTPMTTHDSDWSTSVRFRDRDDDGSRFGVVAYYAGKVSNQGLGLLGGLGVRVGLRQRNSDEMMLMPVLALVGGAIWDTHGVKPWVEQRFELMAARRGGVLLPAYHGWFATGLQFGPTNYSPEPDEARVGEPNMARPYASVGFGWNWLPTGGSEPGGDPGLWNLASLANGNVGAVSLAAAAIIAIAVTAVVFAGRVEVRLIPGFRAGEPTEVAFMIGAGF
jgi:hypothetical protein